MHAIQNLPTVFSPAPTGGLVVRGVRRTVSDRLWHLVALARRRAAAAMDHTRLSPHLVRDIGMVRGEPPYAGAWESARTDYRL